MHWLNIGYIESALSEVSQYKANTVYKMQMYYYVAARYFIFTYNIRFTLFPKYWANILY